VRDRNLRGRSLFGIAHLVSMYYSGGVGLEGSAEGVTCRLPFGIDSVM
jgi:hypothetical protein